MTEPNSAAEFTKRFSASQQITGYGVYGTTMHSPCPFCAAPDWAVFVVMDTEANMKQEHKCAECGRSGKFLVTRDGPNVSFEFVQTAGPEPPPWLQPPPRKV